MVFWLIFKFFLFLKLKFTCSLANYGHNSISGRLFSYLLSYSVGRVEGYWAYLLSESVWIKDLFFCLVTYKWQRIVEIAGWQRKGPNLISSTPQLLHSRKRIILSNVLAADTFVLDILPTHNFLWVLEQMFNITKSMKICKLKKENS